MKYRNARILLALALAATIPGCVTTVYRAADITVKNEQEAVRKLCDDIYFLRLNLQDKRIGVFYFSSLNWEVPPAGKRISQKLANYLAAKGDLSMIPRAELDRIMKIQAIEKASIFDVEAIQRKGKVLPVDVIIMGSIGPAESTVPISIKMVDVRSGRLMLVSGVRMPATAEFASKEDEALLALYKKSPRKIVDMNKTYYSLSWMKSRQPLVFLLAVLSDNEVKTLKTTNKILSSKLAIRRNRYKEDRPDVIKKIKALEEGVDMMSRYEPKRFDEIMKWKKELLLRMR
ncbi:MAG: hypothetical protein JW807_17545 [Spirochaetes bacterium]|nr:hypothetical protein [Spirochaetota bacterium]